MPTRKAAASTDHDPLVKGLSTSISVSDLCASAGSMQGACYSDMCAIGGDATDEIADGYQTALATSTELASIAAGTSTWTPTEAPTTKSPSPSPSATPTEFPTLVPSAFPTRTPTFPDHLTASPCIPRPTSVPSQATFEYRGWALWNQNEQAHSAQESSMDAACASKYSGSRAITMDELVGASPVKNLPASNPTSHWLIPKCGNVESKFCWGYTPARNARMCVYPSWALPKVVPTIPYGDNSYVERSDKEGIKGWTTYCWSNQRSTLCVASGGGLSSFEIPEPEEVPESLGPMNTADR